MVVRYKGNKHDVQCPENVTCAEFLELVSAQTGLKPQYQKLLHKGKVVPHSDEALRGAVQVRPHARFMLLVNEKYHQAGREIEHYGEEIDALLRRYDEELAPVLHESAEEAARTRVKVFRYLDEMCTQTLIKLDGISADGELRQLRKDQVKRAMALAEKLERVKTLCV